MNRKHEQSVIDGFSNFFHDEAERRGRKLTRCSMDGQDVFIGADYLFTDNTRFMLVEFKYEENDLTSESKKPRRKNLCLALDKDEFMRNQSLRCHYISWSYLKGTRKMALAPYYPEICNQKIFGAGSGLAKVQPDISTRIEATVAIQRFLDHSAGTTYYALKQYISWLMSLKGTGENAVEVMLDNPDRGQLEFIEFPSIDSLKNWLDQHKPISAKWARGSGGVKP